MLVSGLCGSIWHTILPRCFVAAVLEYVDWYNLQPGTTDKLLLLLVIVIVAVISSKMLRAANDYQDVSFSFICTSRGGAREDVKTNPTTKSTMSSPLRSHVHQVYL